MSHSLCLSVRIFARFAGVCAEIVFTLKSISRMHHVKE